MTALRIAIAAGSLALTLGGGAVLGAPALVGQKSAGDTVAAMTHVLSTPGPKASAAAGTGHQSSATDADQKGDTAAAAAAARGQSTTNHDQHGDAVAAAAHTCPSSSPSDRDAHGDCVSAVARTNARSPRP